MGVKKRILVIAPASYPVTSAEAIVNIKLLKALSDDGRFEIDLVSKKDKWHDYPSASIESYGVKCNLHMVEVDNKVSNPSVIFQNLMTLAKFGVIYKGCHWAYGALSLVKSLVKKNSYDYVLTKNNPSYLLGWYLKKKYGIKWVASWNDPFPALKYPEPYGRGTKYTTFMYDIMISRMKCADVHIFPSERLYKFMDSYMFIPSSSKIEIASHIIIPQEVNRSQNSDTLRIIHSGSLYNPRSPRSFLSGLKLAIEHKPDMRLSFSILGNMSEADRLLAAELGVDKYVTYLKPVEYSESLNMLANYNVALIIEADCDEGIFMPTKVSDCMQQRIPIFAVAPNVGNLHDLYLNEYISYFADIKSPENISKEITRLYTDFVDSKVPQYSTIKHDYLPSNIVQKYIEL